MEHFLEDLWMFVVLSAPYLILGFLLSGVVHAIFPLHKIKKWLGSNRYRDIFYASAIGVPLPLCSCSVIPAAVALKKAGASRASVSSFLISTPESGIDSIVVTYALMDFPMSVFRPLAAFVTAMMAGLFNHWFNQEKLDLKPTFAEVKADEHNHQHHNHDHGHAHKPAKKITSKIYKIFHYGFVELVDDLAGWLVVGILLGALVSTLVPDNFFATLPPTSSRFIVMLVGIPLYICASASTPIAASLVMKGMSPGVALIFLLTGPATNAATIAVLQKHLGTKGTIINVLSIAICALLFSYIVDFYYEIYGLPTFKIEELHDHTGWFSQAAGVFFILIILSSLYRKYGHKFKKSKSCCG